MLFLCPFVLCLSLRICPDGHCSVAFLIVFAMGVPELLSLAAKPKPSMRCSAAFLSTVLSLLQASAGFLPLGLGAPFFALALCAVAEPLHSGSVCCPDPRWAAGRIFGFLDAWLWEAVSSIPLELSSWSSFQTPGPDFADIYNLGKEDSLMLLHHCLVC